MSVTGVYNRSYAIAGQVFPTSVQITSALVTLANATLGSAKSGTLTTRTNNTDGSLTMAPGHGITTGQRLDIYWAGGSCYGATVGTVNVNVVPFTGASGDNLPLAATSITAMVPTPESIALTGDNAVAIAANMPAGGRVVFAKSDNSTIFGVPERSTTNPGYFYSSGDGGMNPLAGQTVAKVFFSHGSTSATPNVSAAVQFN